MENQTQSPSRATKYAWTLGLVLLVGLGLRLWGIGFDLPYPTHSHEYHEVHRALRLGMGEFDFTRTTKGGYFYLLFLEYSILFVVLFLTGIITSVKEFSLFYLTDPTSFWLIGRGTTALIGTGTVLVLFLIIKRLIGKTPALIGATLLAVYPLHVELSHYISVDVPMVFLLTLTLYFCISVLEYQRRRDYLLAGFFLALAVMTKFPAIPFALCLGIAHIMVIRARDAIPKGLLDRNLVYGCTVFLVTYISGNPGVVGRFGAMVRNLTPFVASDPNLPEASALLFSGYKPNLFLYYGNVLIGSLGLFVVVLSLCGLALSVYMDRKTGIIMAVFTVTYFSAICLSGSLLFYPRYVLPLVPFLLIGFAYCYRWIVENEKIARLLRQRTSWVCLALIGLMIVPSVVRSIEDDIEFNKSHTRIIAKEWVEENVAPGSRILAEGNPSSAYPKVPLQRLPENLLAVAEEIMEEKPGKAEYLRRLSQIQEGVAFEVTMVWSRFELYESLEYYQDLGIEYIILNPIKHDRRFDAKRQHGDALRESRFALYDQIKEQENVELVISFDAEELDAKGHPIEIYRIGEEPIVTGKVVGTDRR